MFRSFDEPGRFRRAASLLMAAALLGLSMTPAWADRDDRHDRGHDRGWHRGRGNPHRGPVVVEERPVIIQQRPVYVAPPQPVYVAPPPPVYYAPPPPVYRQPSGIDLFLRLAE